MQQVDSDNAYRVMLTSWQKRQPGANGPMTHSQVACYPAAVADGSLGKPTTSSGEGVGQEIGMNGAFEVRPAVCHWSQREFN